VIKLSDIKEIYRPSESKTEAALKKLKNKIDVIITNNEWEADEVFEHDYASSEILDCIIYYVTGFSIYIFFPQYCIVLNTHVFCFLKKRKFIQTINKTSRSVIIKNITFLRNI